MKTLLICYDNGSYIGFPPQGTACIAAILRQHGHDVVIYNQDVYRFEDEHLTQYLDNNEFDVVGMGIIAGYYQYQKLLKISKAINESKNRKNFIYILGGHGPSPEPEYFLRKTNADFVVHGEGEATIVDLLNNLNKLEFVDGISYIKDNVFYQNKPRKELRDIDMLPFPAWDLFPLEHYVLIRQPGFEQTDRLMTMESGRGCPYTCNFCVTENTLIKTPNGDKKIKDIFVDDKIISYDEKNKNIVENKVSEIFERIDEEYFNIYLENGDLLEISAEHPVYTKRGWIEVKDLTNEDELLCL